MTFSLKTEKYCKETDAFCYLRFCGLRFLVSFDLHKKRSPQVVNYPSETALAFIF